MTAEQKIAHARQRLAAFTARVISESQALDAELATMQEAESKRWQKVTDWKRFLKGGKRG